MICTCYCIYFYAYNSLQIYSSHIRSKYGHDVVECTCFQTRTDLTSQHAVVKSFRPRYSRRFAKPYAPVSSTKYPVYVSHRLTRCSDEQVKRQTLAPLSNIAPRRLNLLRLNLSSGAIIASVTQSPSKSLDQNGQSDSYIHTTFMRGGIIRFAL
ncbi:hypothetical protein BDQ12DRAFT_168208 [Crucibulum laeve]|uniref:Uncharacterized protein n=1 Tax=Crucibulum laeve TaxID=68775 RepID=A0A5C3MCK8_9AGAR|nr:hypothetical protein BDQ12DRAFT_168208 [Crucibulum laeve]